MTGRLAGLAACSALVLSGCVSQQTSAFDPPSVSPLKGSVGSLGVSPPRKSNAKTSAVMDGERMTCKGLENAIDVHVTKVVALQRSAKTESEQSPPTVERALTRMFGSQDSDNKALSELTTEQNQLDHYRAVMQSKGCAPVDIAAKIAAAPVPIPPEKPSFAKSSGNKI